MILILLILSLCGCDKRRRITAKTIPTDWPINIKIDSSETFLSKIEEILFYSVILISFFGTIIGYIRIEIIKYKDNIRINDLERGLNHIISNNNRINRNQNELNGLNNRLRHINPSLSDLTFSEINIGNEIRDE